MTEKEKIAGHVLTGLLVLVFVISACGVGSVMHESDQASYISGAWQMAHSVDGVDVSSFYRYEKFFGAYWLLAGVYKLLPSVDPVLSGNLFSFGVFWCAVFAVYIRFKLWRSLLRQSPFIATVCSPVVLVHIPYFAPNYISAAFLLFGLVVLKRSFVVALLLWAVSMSVRADAVLLVPLLAWISCGEASLKRLVLSLRSYALAGGAVAVLVLGKLLSPGSEALGYQFFFIPKLFAGYLVFGLGGAAVVLFSVVGVLLFRQYRNWDERLFWWGGCVALLMPFSFYSLLLFSTRHWAVVVTGLVLFICSAHWKPIEGRGKKWSAAVLLCALVPLFVGVKLPFPSKPALTVSMPTLFPTADGRNPMGAIFPFMLSGQRLDHNHQTWVGARSVEHWDKIGGKVPVAVSPLDTFVELAVRLNGQVPDFRVSLPEDDEERFAYIPCRTLLKSRVEIDKARFSAAGKLPANYALELVSGLFPYGMVRVQRDGSVHGDSELKWRINMFRAQFAGDELFWIGDVAGGVFLPDKNADGCRLVFISKTPFKVLVEGAEFNALPVDGVKGFSVSIAGYEWHGKEISVSGKISVARSVYPDYMSLQQLK